MDIITSPRIMQERAKTIRNAGGCIGFVPTMGFLHEGHLSLIRALGEEPQTRIMSIFVNPTQFGHGEDFEQYPRNMQRDAHLAEENGIDILYTPSAADMYPEGAQTTVSVSTLTRGLCGDFRPEHFDGVTTVVALLINIVKPHRLVLGQKDFQQAVVCRRMVRDLWLDTEIITAPIVREPDGLALSSRNVYLSPEERSQALALSRSLLAAQQAVKDGAHSADDLRHIVTETLSRSPLVEPQYIFIGSPDTLTVTDQLEGEILVALAAMVGKTRLIDNMVIRVPE